MIKPESWTSTEDEYIDIWCCTLVEVLAELKLVKRETSEIMWSWDNGDLYERENDHFYCV